MKDSRNTSGGDVSSTSRTSQSLTNSSLALSGWLPLQAPVSAGLRIAKSLKLSGFRPFSL
ncbi:hypothetical protein GmHk_18G052001 [Glycine max]|nr:hypothetical protein GmHk_18G052001 [Glycine max]